MTDRLPTGVVATALIRRVNAAGGFATVLSRGGQEGGGILVVAVDRGSDPKLLERGIGNDGKTTLIDSTPAGDVGEYCARRRMRDPDLWVIEVDIAGAERFAAETILAN